MGAIRIRRIYQQFAGNGAVKVILYRDINFTVITAANGRSSLLPFVLGSHLICALTDSKAIVSRLCVCVWMPIFTRHQVCKSYFSFEQAIRSSTRSSSSNSSILCAVQFNCTLNITVIISTAPENIHLI